MQIVSLGFVTFFRRKSYSWLLQMMAPVPKHQKDKGIFISPTNKLGLEVSITETAIFRQGRLHCVVRNNKNGRISKPSHSISL